MANEERRAVLKREKAVERARGRKGAGSNQPSILSQFRKMKESQPNILSGGSRQDTTLTVPVTERRCQSVNISDSSAGEQASPVPKQGRNRELEIDSAFGARPG